MHLHTKDVLSYKIDWTRNNRKRQKFRIRGKIKIRQRARRRAGPRWTKGLAARAALPRWFWPRTCGPRFGQVVVVAESDRRLLNVTTMKAAALTGKSGREDVTRKRRQDNYPHHHQSCQIGAARFGFILFSALKHTRLSRRNSAPPPPRFPNEVSNQSRTRKLRHFSFRSDAVAAVSYPSEVRFFRTNRVRSPSPGFLILPVAARGHSAATGFRKRTKV